MPPAPRPAAPRAPWRERWNAIIFRHDSRSGRVFDLVLLVLILLSVLAVSLESVPRIRQAYGTPLRVIEWGITVLFTVEYMARIATATDAVRYVRSFFGIVDLLSIAPVYLGLLFGTGHALSVVRTLRLLRVFRILKLTQFVSEANVLVVALRASARKITVFLFFVVTVVTVVGALMYEIEGERSGFTSIPAGMYWAVVTVTTVGYGDISPHTVLGRLLASVLMIMGYGIIAIPTGIFSFELARNSRDRSRRGCPSCGLRSHDGDASFCKRCGASLEE